MDSISISDIREMAETVIASALDDLDIRGEIAKFDDISDEDRERIADAIGDAVIEVRFPDDE